MQLIPRDKPTGTDGFEFVECAAPDPAALGCLVESMGFDHHAEPMERNIPAIKDGGDSLIDFADRWPGKGGAAPGAIGDISICDIDFVPIADAEPCLVGHGIAIDGATHLGAPHELLLEVFTQTVTGPGFFEIIQRNGVQGLGQSSFRALFESIELDPLRGAVLGDGAPGQGRHA